jgi:hypothetical protein
MNRGLKQYLIAVPPWIILGALAILVPIFVFWTLQNISKEREYVVRLLTEKGSALLRSIEAGARTGMMGVRGDGFRVQRLITETARTPDVVHLIVTDADGTILAHSDEGRSDKGTGPIWISSAFPDRTRCSGGRFPDLTDPPPLKFSAVSRPHESPSEASVGGGCKAQVHGQGKCGRRFLRPNNPRSFL